jgi:hypothetical protein
MMRGMGGLDPQTAWTLGIAGVLATVFASLIAAGSNLIGQLIQRGTAKQVALIQAKRQYREQITAAVRLQVSARLGLIVALQEAVKANNRVSVTELTEQLRTADIHGDMSLYGLVPDLLEHLMRLGNATAEAIELVEKWREDGNSSSLADGLEKAAGWTVIAIEDINREMERYVLDLSEPMRLHRPSSG